MATMPALSTGRQPNAALAWFGGVAGQGLLDVESAAMARVLAGCQAMPWAWIGVDATSPPGGTSTRGVRLRRQGLGFDGAFRSVLPLPLASEALGAVLLQHVLDDGIDPMPLLDECARVLAPGGTLWLAALNPWSPYRARWARSGLHAYNTGAWQSMLRGAGFAADSVSLQWLGPLWRPAHGAVGIGAADRLRAGIGLTVSKRVHALIPPARLRNLRWQAGGALAGTNARRSASQRR
ncbi:Methyltransferase domain-containing protein [Lysobacter sp. cf310]|nr:Methyltransferase domain-containing protein [Lysobacter sp. cf310]